MRRQAFATRYAVLLPRGGRRGAVDDREACARICERTDAPVGRTKVFLRETTLSFLEEERIRVGAQRIQALVRGCAARQFVTQLRAAVRIQSLIRGHMARVFVTKQRAAVRIQSRIRGHMARVLVKMQRAAVRLQSRMRVRLARLLVQRLRRAAALARQEAAARELQQWWRRTHPTPVATTTISFCEHTGVMDVSEVVRLADLSNDLGLPGPVKPCRGWSWCGGEDWRRREKRGGTTTVSVPYRKNPVRSSSITDDWRLVRAPSLVQTLRRSTPTEWQECQYEISRLLAQVQDVPITHDM